MAVALEQILQRHPVWRGKGFALQAQTVATGYADLDCELPGGGWPTAALSEILCPGEGIGELSLLAPAFAALTSAGKRVVWLSPPHLPYAPALAAAGIDLTQLAVVRAPGRRDALWAAEQVLKSGACHAFVAWFRNIRYEELRRLALAAESGRAFAVLFRSPQAARESSPACLRLALEPAGSALAVHILKRRGAPSAAALHLAVKRPVHALGRSAFPESRARGVGTDRRVGLPVHA